MENIKTRLTTLFLVTVCVVGITTNCTSFSNEEQKGWTEQNFILFTKDGNASLKDVLALDFTPLDGNYPNVGEQSDGIWLKKNISSISDKYEDLSFITRGVDSLKLYLVSDKGLQLDESITGGHINPIEREFTSSFSTYSFRLRPKETVHLYINAKNVNYKLSLFPYEILNVSDTKSYINNCQLLQSLYIGAMVIMLLFGSAMFILFYNSLYLYYSFCALLSLTMMLVNYDYSYIFFDKLPQLIISKNIYGVITVLLPLNYFLFARSFLLYKENTKKVVDKAVPFIVCITFGIILVFLFFDLSFFQYRNYIEAIIFVLVGLPLVLLFYSLKHGYKPAWFFLVATVPVLFMGVLESLSGLHNFPVQQMHTYYYITTFFELFVLTIGLSVKFKNFQEERNHLYQQMLDKEITTREEERIRIAQDLHDTLGGLVAATKLKFKIVQNQLKNTPDEASFNSGMELLDNTATSIRQIAHSLASVSLTKMGLIDALREQFNTQTNPSIYINESNFEDRLNSDQEQALYAIVIELISNAVKHANAEEILVFFKVRDEIMTITIEDDGRGFDTKNVAFGMGLANVQFRVKEHLNGTIHFQPRSNGRTIIEIIFKPQ